MSELPALPAPHTAYLYQEHAALLANMDDEQFWAYVAACAQVVPGEQASSNDFLVGDLGVCGCLINLAAIRVVEPLPDHVSLLPRSPTWLLGIVAWSGSPLAVIDLRAYVLHCPVEPVRAPALLLVAQHNDMLLGFSVPVLGISTIFDVSRLHAPDQAEQGYEPPCVGAISGIFTDGVAMGMDDTKVSLVLDMPVILTDLVEQLRISYE